jgi:hypothetical protein
MPEDAANVDALIRNLIVTCGFQLGRDFGVLLVLMLFE